MIKVNNNDFLQTRSRIPAEWLHIYIYRWFDLLFLSYSFRIIALLCFLFDGYRIMIINWNVSFMSDTGHNCNWDYTHFKSRFSIVILWWKNRQVQKYFMTFFLYRQNTFFILNNIYRLLTMPKKDALVFL